MDYQTPSGLEGGGAVELRHCLQLESRGGMTRGAIMHAWLQRVRWIEEGVPDDATFAKIAGPWSGPELDLPSELRRFRAILSKPVVRSVLSRDTYRDAYPAGEPELFAERKFAIREGNTIVQGAMDRLVLLSAGGKRVAADIIDFKTDAVMEPAAIAARVAFYRPQLEAYRRCVAALTGLSVDQITARVLFVEPGVLQMI